MDNWWFGTVVTWKEIIYAVILLAGSIYGFIKWISAPDNLKYLKYKKKSFLFLFLGFFCAFIIFLLYLTTTVSAARAAMVQGISNAPPVPLWGSLRILEWSFLIAGGLISFFFNIYAQKNIKIGNITEDPEDKD